MTARPRLRGLLHQYAFFASLLALPVLILVSPTGRAARAGMVYGLRPPRLEPLRRVQPPRLQQRHRLRACAMLCV
jgi:hypothetical protein